MHVRRQAAGGPDVPFVVHQHTLEMEDVQIDPQYAEDKPAKCAEVGQVARALLNVHGYQQLLSLHLVAHRYHREIDQLLQIEHKLERNRVQKHVLEVVGGDEPAAAQPEQDRVHHESRHEDKEQKHRLDPQRETDQNHLALLSYGPAVPLIVVVPEDVVHGCYGRHPPDQQLDEKGQSSDVHDDGERPDQQNAECEVRMGEG
mmetsp:Transcript_58074/g.187993  ORF Transcript_58074/g.187993 Transcript_58074/m.187993 type:complete len:202 (+) Transcript_58074:106-711(+)